MYKLFSAWVVVSLLSAMVSGCGVQGKDRMARFHETFLAYSGHLRWGDFHRVAAFSTAGRADAAYAAAAGMKNIRVSGVESSNWLIDESQDRIRGSVKIQYYLPERGVIRETTQRQTWLWLEEAKQWKLDAALPDLRQ